MGEPVLKSGRSRLFNLLLLVLTACAPQASSNLRVAPAPTDHVDAACEVVAHDWGTTEFCNVPQRVIALDPHALDLLLSLGIQPIGYAEDQRALVGLPASGQPVIDVKYLGPYLTQKPAHVGTWQTPSMETMLQLQPDLILGGYLDRTQYANFSKLAPTLLPIDDWQFKDQWQHNLITLGRLFQREERVQQIIDNYRQRIQTLKAEANSISDRRVLLLSMSGLDYIGVFNEATFAGGMLQELGFELVVPEAIATHGEIAISLETLPDLKASTIIVMASSDSTIEQVQQVWEQNSVLKTLPASQAKRVYVVDYQLWSRIQGAIAAELMLTQVEELLLDKNEV